MTSWDDRAEAYRESKGHREGRDLDLLVDACGPCEGLSVLDVATGGGHVARRLRERGCDIVTTYLSPGMQPDVVCPAEHLPFADASFDVVVCRIAPHHFSDIRGAVRELARVSKRLVVVEDNLYIDDVVEEAERVRDPSHVRCYSEAEWRVFFEQAGLEVEGVERFERERSVDDWLERVGCEGDDAERVKELLRYRIEDGRLTLPAIVVKARKR